MKVLQSFVVFALCTFTKGANALGIYYTEMNDIYLKSQRIQTSLEKTIGNAKSIIQTMEVKLSEAEKYIWMLEDKLKVCGQNSILTEQLEMKPTPTDDALKEYIFNIVEERLIKFKHDQIRHSENETRMLAGMENRLSNIDELEGKLHKPESAISRVEAELEKNMKVVEYKPVAINQKSSGYDIAENASASYVQMSTITKATSDNDVIVDQWNDRKNNEINQVYSPQASVVGTGIIRGAMALGIDYAQMSDIYLRSYNIHTSLENTIDIAKSMIPSVEIKLSEAQKYVGTLENKLKVCGQNNMLTEQLEMKPTPSNDASKEYIMKIVEERLFKSEHDQHHHSESVTRMLVSLENRLSNIDELEGFRAATSDRVAFRVSGILRADGHFSGERIVFASVDYNEGSGYDVTSGTFICPTTGTYFFTATIGSIGRVYVDAVVKIDGVVKMSLYAGYHLQGDNMSTAVTIAHCRVGQSVWMEVSNGDHLGGWESMSGFLL